MRLDRPTPPTPGKQNGRRAGRDLPKAIAVGVSLGVLGLITVLLSRLAFVVLVGVIVLIATWELTRAVKAVGAHPPIVPLLLGGATIQAVTWFAGAEGLVVSLFLTLLGCCVWRLGDGPVGYLRDTSTAAFVVMYVPFLAGFGALMSRQDDSAQRILIFLALVVASDIGGYAAGVFLGKHPIAPTVSPKKSWEGFFGSLAACAILGAILMPAFFGAGMWQGVLFGLAIAATATLGDLGESMIKRDLDIKDMGSLLPGHGGAMDRLDSLLPSAPVAYLLLSLFV